MLLLAEFGRSAQVFPSAPEVRIERVEKLTSAKYDLRGH